MNCSRNSGPLLSKTSPGAHLSFLQVFLCVLYEMQSSCEMFSSIRTGNRKPADRYMTVGEGLDPPESLPFRGGGTATSRDGRVDSRL